jgi:hypothetical protein
MKKARSFAHVVASVVLVGASFLAAGCGDPATPAASGTLGNSFTAPLPAGLQSTASILDLMLYPIDTHADELWEAVATVSTMEGTRDVYPQTAEEWTTLRQKAIMLAEAANLLVTEGRRVGHPGQKIEGPGESTDLTPEQAQAEIDKDPAAFAVFAMALQNAARQLVDAIDRRNVEDYLTAGSGLQEACEGCHRRYWYPHSPLPPGL